MYEWKLHKCLKNGSGRPEQNNVTTAFGAVYSGVYWQKCQKRVSDVNQLKQRMIELWSGLQQTIVNEATGEYTFLSTFSINSPLIF